MTTSVDVDAITAAARNLASRVTEKITEIVAERDALAAQVERIRHLHRPVTIDILAVACFRGTCNCHNDCPEIPTEVCSECDRIREEADDEGSVIPWPCLTIGALTP